VLFGSRARGDQHLTSDVDLLVAGRPDSDLLALTDRLSKKFGVHVQLVPLEDAERSPRLLAEVLREGRVVLDRAGIWPRLKERRRAISRAAGREQQRIASRFDAKFATSR
jgi:predicted nucleotidyltransferase